MLSSRVDIRIRDSHMQFVSCRGPQLVGFAVSSPKNGKSQNQDGFGRFWVLCASMNHLSEPNCGAEKNGKSERSAVFSRLFPSHFRV